MDIFTKIDTLIKAAARSKLPRRKRRSPLDEQEEKLLAEVRQAVAGVQAQEQKLAAQVKAERAQAETAAQQGDRSAERTHQRRATELERELEQESIQAINLEEKLAALEEKLSLAKEAVAKQEARAAAQAEEAEKTMALGLPPDSSSVPTADFDFDSAPAIMPPADDDAGLEARKSRLGD